jgi:hypothetical protein
LPRAREQGLENLKPVLHKTKKTTKMKMMMSPKPEDFAVTSQKLMENFPRKKLGNLHTRVQSDRIFLKKQKNLLDN